MSNARETINITIDGRTFEARRGATILEAARANGIYIPTLCAHETLTSFGGCRMCIVEVDGMRGFPTSCTTPAEDGMVVRTETEQLRTMQLEILRLILSEHTSSCLVCDEREECARYSPTIRKAGVTTGCRFCPKDGQCELQEVARRLGVKEIGYPVYYRNLQVEKEDPFYDRDYNLCILCGRCVRVCQEVRSAGTLAFSLRGRRTIVGPAFGRSHLEAGCEFCGACVSVCPTGALYERATKWEGRPEREQESTCVLCGIGCRVRLQVKGGRVIGSLPADDPLVNDGQLCVKGRFCITELVGGHQRLLRPSRRRGGAPAEIGWDEAVSLAAERLASCDPANFALLVSADCSNEDLYTAQKFARAVMGTHHVDTASRLYYRAGFNAYLDLMKVRLPLAELRHAGAVLCIGLDARFGRSVVGVEIRKALRNGARMVTIHPRPHSLGMIADRWIRPRPGEEARVLEALVRLTGSPGEAAAGADAGLLPDGLAQQADETARWLLEARAPVLLVGSEFLHYDGSAEILAAVARLARNTAARILPLPAQGNLVGSVLMGSYPELLPGGVPSTDGSRLERLRLLWAAPVAPPEPWWNASVSADGRKLEVLYAIGEVPPAMRQRADFLIFQNIYPPEPDTAADLILPSAAFTETDGTMVSGDGLIQRLHAAVPPPGKALPNWQILCRIAQKLDKSGFDYQSAADVYREIAQVVEGFGEWNALPHRLGPLSVPGRLAWESGAPAGSRTASELPLTLSVSVQEHRYQGFPLSRWVEGAAEIFAEETVDMSPADAAAVGVASGDRVIVAGGHFERTWRARIVPDQPEGVLHATVQPGGHINPNPVAVRMRKSDV